MFAPHQLFNCCTELAEPDWNEFTSLEIGACRIEIDETGAEWTAGGLSRDDAEFFTIYGRNQDGEAEAITDIETYLGGCLILAELVRISELSASFTC